MKIGFIQPDEDDSSIAEPGYAETAVNVGDEDGGWLGWALPVFINFCLLYGASAIVKDLISYLQAW
ncbi:hypothetical protein ES705_10681 [subsurface metagenome]